MWHSNDKENLSAKHLVFLILYEDKYRKVVYRCNDKFTKTDKFNGEHKCENTVPAGSEHIAKYDSRIVEGKTVGNRIKCVTKSAVKHSKNICESLTLTEDQIKNLFMESLNEVITNKDEIIKNIESTLKYFDVSKLETEYNTLETSLQTEIDKINNKVYEQAAGKDVEINHSKYEALKAKLDKIGEKINEMNDKKNRLREYVEELRGCKISKYRDEYKYKDCDFRAEQFRAEFWGQFLDKMVVYKDKVKVVFKDGREVVKEV